MKFEDVFKVPTVQWTDETGRRHPYVACYYSSYWVTLSDSEYSDALVRGERIWKWSQEHGLTERRANPNSTVSGCWLQQLGCIGETVVCKALSIPIVDTMNTFKRADLPFNIEVRTIGVENRGLRVSPRDDDSRRVVGVVIPKGKEREPLRIAGWINAVYGKKPGYQQILYGKPTFYVPQERLFKFTDLIEIMKT